MTLFFVYDFSRFHHNNFRDTISWECVVKDDCITSCLKELESFTSSKFSCRPNTQCLDVFSTFCLNHASRGASRSMSYGSLCSLFIGSTAVKNTVCLSLLEFCLPGIDPEFVVECTLIAHPI